MQYGAALQDEIMLLFKTMLVPKVKLQEASSQYEATLEAETTSQDVTAVCCILLNKIEKKRMASFKAVQNSFQGGAK